MNRPPYAWKDMRNDTNAPNAAERLSKEGLSISTDQKQFLQKDRVA